MPFCNSVGYSKLERCLPLITTARRKRGELAQEQSEVSRGLPGEGRQRLLPTQQGPNPKSRFLGNVSVVWASLCHLTEVQNQHGQHNCLQKSKWYIRKQHVSVWVKLLFHLQAI